MWWHNNLGQAHRDYCWQPRRKRKWIEGGFEHEERKKKHKKSLKLSSVSFLMIYACSYFVIKMMNCLSLLRFIWGVKILNVQAVKRSLHSHP